MGEQAAADCVGKETLEVLGVAWGGWVGGWVGGCVGGGRHISPCSPRLKGWVGGEGEILFPFSFLVRCRFLCGLEFSFSFFF